MFNKSQFISIEPVPHYLGQNELGKECFSQYIPVKHTVHSGYSLIVMQMKSLSRSRDVLSDIGDGSNML